MSVKTKWEAARLALLAVAVLVAAVVVVSKFGADLERVNWRLVSIICAVVFASFMMYRWNAYAPRYNFLDMFTDANGRADLWKHCISLSWVAAMVLIFQQALANQPVTELMLGVLGFFLVKVGAQGFSDALKDRPAAPDPGDININVPAKPVIAPAPDLALAQGESAPQPLSPKIAQADVGGSVAIERAGTTAGLRKSSNALRRQVAATARKLDRARKRK